MHPGEVSRSVRCEGCNSSQSTAARALTKLCPIRMVSQTRHEEEFSCALRQRGRESNRLSIDDPPQVSQCICFESFKNTMATPLAAEPHQSTWNAARVIARSSLRGSMSLAATSFRRAA
eukprot:1993186-Pleurochrysis_carterae.AAC.1